MINEKLIRPLEREFRSSKNDILSITFKGKELKETEPWISPEINDMKVFDLPCCNRKIKIQENWDKFVYCFFCGFLYE